MISLIVSYGVIYHTNISSLSYVTVRQYFGLHRSGEGGRSVSSKYAKSMDSTNVIYCFQCVYC